MSRDPRVYFQPLNKLWLPVVLAIVLAPGASRDGRLPAAEQAAIDRISADSLRGNLSFLASDALEGRGTPSRGLDIAAEYIAAQFRRGGLEPLGDDGYFQTADWNQINPRRPKTPPATPLPPARVRNVAGVLRGSDPALKDT